MHRVEVDLSTKEQKQIALTPEEVAQRAIEELENAPSYAELRAEAYPSFAEQFDLLYHGGYEAWREIIQAVKDKYPKPE